MRITDITLHNFRNYRDLNVALGAQATVFIGRNGMGKSNLMGALHRAIRFVFAFFSDSYPHVKAHIGKKTQAMLDSGNALPRNMGYYKWDDERNCAEVWNQYSEGKVT